MSLFCSSKIISDRQFFNAFISYTPELYFQYHDNSGMQLRKVLLKLAWGSQYFIM